MRSRLGVLPAIAAPACSTTAAPIAVASTEARLARPSFVHFDVAALEFGIVELADRFGNLFRSCRLDEAEAFRLSGEFIRDDRGALHLANL